MTTKNIISILKTHKIKKGFIQFKNLTFFFINNNNSSQKNIIKKSHFKKPQFLNNKNLSPRRFLMTKIGLINEEEDTGFTPNMCVIK